MARLYSILRGINLFAESYNQMYEIRQANQTIEVKMLFMEDQNLDMRRYNAPTSRTEIAAIFVSDDVEPLANRDICIFPIGDNCKNISPMNRCSDPMVDPLLSRMWLAYGNGTSGREKIG